MKVIIIEEAILRDDGNPHLICQLEATDGNTSDVIAFKEGDVLPFDELILFGRQSHAVSALPVTEQNAQNLSFLGGSHLIHITGNQSFSVADLINVALGNTLH